MGTSSGVRSTKYCHACGYVIDAYAEHCPNCGAAQPGMALTHASDKRIMPAFLLCAMLGFVGAHRFYVGKTGTAIAQIFTLGGLGIWALVDAVMLVTGSFTDKQGNKITIWT